uniref:Uncharacterized protein n=1 Tax=Alexandrium andersonii TaxID=327968 RepID=A0A7S2MLJ8_9DINO|mmetsp:Transcript_71356/g.159769  ORF Transcript_71356/g.159769 Transcript_71356/m.159769 type:complete len:274 (+) Transcript_71356:81-902(+)
MAPVKFDDISKTANEVISDDFQTSGYQFKAKQKTNFDGAVLTSTVDLAPKDACMTPAKLTFKLPSPLGIGFVCIDKLEMDKAGKYKLEASSDKAYPGLKLECKSDLVDTSKVSAGFTYTGMADTLVKFETKPAKPQDFTVEVTRAAGIATFGCKAGMANISCPDLGVRLLSGNFFCSLYAKEKISAFTAHCFYKATPELKVAASCDCGKKKAFTLGLAYDVMKGTKLKVKVQQDQSVSCSVKHDVAKGFTILAGARYDTKKQDYTTGLQLSIE